MKMREIVIFLMTIGVKEEKNTMINFLSYYNILFCKYLFILLIKFILIIIWKFFKLLLTLFIIRHEMHDHIFNKFCISFFFLFFCFIWFYFCKVSINSVQYILFFNFIKSFSYNMRYLHYCILFILSNN